MANPVFVSPQVLVEGHPTDLADLGVGQVAVFTGGEARHARKVMRLKRGEPLDLVDGVGTRVVAEVYDLPEGAEEALTVRATEVLREESPSPQVTLVQALAKGARGEQAVETATEVGVDRFVPWVADRSISRWKPAKYGAGQQRWQRVADAASKQSRRAHFAKVDAPVNTAALTATLREASGRGDTILVCHEDAVTPLSEALAGVTDGGDFGGRVWLVVGPEGGFSSQETEAFQMAGGQLVKLGSNILRASTAGPAAMAALNTIFGRW